MKRFDEIVTDVTLLQGAKAVYSPVEGGWLGFSAPDARSAISAAKARPFVVAVGVNSPHVAKASRGRFLNLVEINFDAGVVAQANAAMPRHLKLAQQRKPWDFAVRLKRVWLIDDLPLLSNVLGPGGTGLLASQYGRVQDDTSWVQRIYTGLKNQLVAVYPIHDGSEQGLETHLIDSSGALLS